MALTSSVKHRSRCCLDIFFFLNASPSTENMQNANVKAVPPPSSAQAHCSTGTGRGAFLGAKLAASEARTARCQEQNS